MPMQVILWVLHQSMRIKNENREKERQRIHKRDNNSLSFLFFAFVPSATISNHCTKIDQFHLISYEYV